MKLCGHSNTLSIRLPKNYERDRGPAFRFLVGTDTVDADALSWCADCGALGMPGKWLEPQDRVREREPHRPSVQAFPDDEEETKP